MNKKLGRTNSLNIEITSNFNSLNDSNKKAILYTFEEKFIGRLSKYKEQTCLKTVHPQCYFMG